MKFRKRDLIARLEHKLTEKRSELCKIRPEPETDYEKLGEEFLSHFKAWVVRVKQEFNPNKDYNPVLAQMPVWRHPYKNGANPRASLESQIKIIESHIRMLSLCADETVSMNSRDYNVQQIFQLIGI